MKKIAFTSKGTALIKEAGATRRATEAEVGAYLKSLVPAEKSGAKLDAVKYDDGFVFARYDDGKVFKKRIAQSSTKQTEPVNSGDKADPDLKTPRSEKHRKPETKEIVKDRPDVGKEKEVRKKDHKRGNGGDDLHTDVIPRSKSNSGLEGSKKTDFEKEKANDATSGKPDTYVQKLNEQPKPTPSGNADNRATAGANTASASDGLRVESESTIYQKIKIAEEEKEKDGKPVPPWLKDKKDKKGGNNDDEEDGEKDEKDSDDEDDKDSKKEAKLVKELKTKIAENEKTINTLKKEASRHKVREARQTAALKLALAYRDTNPEQFPTVESVADKVVELCKQMNSEALESTYEQVKAIRVANSKKSVVKTASVNEGISTAFSTPIESISEMNSSNDVDSLREALMGRSALGKKVAEMDAYHNSIANS